VSARRPFAALQVETWKGPPVVLSHPARSPWAALAAAIMRACGRLRLENDPAVSVRVNPEDLPVGPGVEVDGVQVDLTTDQTPGEVLAIGRHLAHAEPIR
jgi:hypothetical protein